LTKEISSFNGSDTDKSSPPSISKFPETSTIASLAVYLKSLTFDDLSEGTRHSARRCILDVISCAAAGRWAPLVNEVVDIGTRWALAAFPSGNASIWFDNGQMSPLGAAFANSLAASVLDVDDGHRAASGHPGAAVIPAVIAVGQVIDARWQDLLTAIVCGYEAGVRAASARLPWPLCSGATGRWAAIAVAVAAAKLRGLSAIEMANAIALAEAQAPNMAAADHAGFAGSHAKEGIPWSVLTGLAAVEQAALGFKGYLWGLDNPSVYKPKLIGTRDRRAFLIESTYFKPYASCRWTHSAIDAVLDMRNGGIHRASIEQIEVASFQRAISLQNRARPSDIIAAQFSIPFVIAVALVEGGDALLPMSSELLDRGDIIDVAERVVLVLDRELDACFPAEVPARVTIRTREGSLQREIRCPRGDVSNPLSDSQLIEKALRLCAAVKPPNEVRRFAEGVLESTSTQQDASNLRAMLDRYLQPS
jgi:2-methylcitrate dehydratase PrpD